MKYQLAFTPSAELDIAYFEFSIRRVIIDAIKNICWSMQMCLRSGENN
jgi:hypothetical protein